MVHLDNQLRRASANIIEPSGTSDNSLKFMAGLTVAVTLVADIDEVENIQDVRIKVRLFIQCNVVNYAWVYCDDLLRSVLNLAGRFVNIYYIKKNANYDFFEHRLLSMTGQSSQKAGTFISPILCNNM